MSPAVKPVVWLLEVLIGIVVICGLPLMYIGAGLDWCRAKLKGEKLSLKPGEAVVFSRADRWNRC